MAAYVDPNCLSDVFEDPLVAYAHLRLDPQGGQAVTGGTVVADPALPELEGRYVYGDFVTGRVWSYNPQLRRVELLLETGVAISDISSGANGELLVLGIGGSLSRVVHAD